MQNYPSNSRKDREVPLTKKTEKKVEKIVTGKAVERKKTLGQRFVESFGGDSAQGVWNYILFDVAIPATKDMVSDMVSQGIERMLFGESRGRSSARYRPSNGPSYTSYNRMSGPTNRYRPEENRRDLSRQDRATHNFGNIVLESKMEAEQVLDTLIGLVDEYHQATVADLYEMTGIVGQFTDERYGWEDFRGADIRRVRDGWLLELPPVRELER